MPKPVEMAVIVMAYKAPPSLTAAVLSILEQAPDIEIIVINSGGGNAQSQLLDAGITVPVVESPSRLLPGGARNLGIHLSKSRYISFLAADCTAEAHWIEERLKMHLQGHTAVASTLLCHRPRHPIAIAAHLSLFFRRMPRTPTDIALAYGASYDRQLFTTHGLFRDDIRGGEDTEFHLRLAPSERPVWHPSVQTIHHGLSSLPQFITDQFSRGRRSAEAWFAIGQVHRSRFAWGVIQRIQWTLKMALKVVEPDDRPFAMLALPLICLGGIVYATGALFASTATAAHSNRD